MFALIYNLIFICCNNLHLFFVKYFENSFLFLGDPVLRLKCEPVKREDISSQRIQQLIDQMKSTLGEKFLVCGSGFRSRPVLAPENNL